MSLKNVSSRYLYHLAIIPIGSTRTMWSNYTVTEQMETASKVRQQMKNLKSCAQSRSLQTLNLVISRDCLYEDGDKCTKMLVTLSLLTDDQYGNGSLPWTYRWASFFKLCSAVLLKIVSYKNSPFYFARNLVLYPSWRSQLALKCWLLRREGETANIY